MKLTNSLISVSRNTTNETAATQQPKETANASLLSRLVKTAKGGSARTQLFHTPEQKKKAIADRKAEAVNTDTLRLTMRDTRDATRKCMEQEDWQGAHAHCQSLRDLSRKAIRMGDEALCNGGILTLGELGTEALNNGNTDAARKIAKLIAETGKSSIRKGRMGPVRTADVALRQMRHTAQQNFGNEGFADKLLRINMDMFNEHGEGIVQTLLESGLKAIRNDDTLSLKKVLDDLDGVVRSASKQDFPVSISNTLHALPALVHAAWEAGDEPLANTIILRFATLSEQAAKCDDADALVDVALAQNKLSQQADEAGQPHSAALLRVHGNQTMEAAKQLPGGVPTFLTRFPIDAAGLSTAAADTTAAAQRAIYSGEKDDAIEHTQTLRDIGITLLRKGSTADMEIVGVQLAGLGRTAAESRNLALLDVVTDTLTTLADYASRAGYDDVASRIASQHESFADAWSIALKHKGTETENLKDRPKFEDLA